MDPDERLAAFERMLQGIKNDLENTQAKMRLLKAQGKEKTVTYRQLIGDKLQKQSLLALYAFYGLLDEDTK